MAPPPYAHLINLGRFDGMRQLKQAYSPIDAQLTHSTERLYDAPIPLRVIFNEISVMMHHAPDFVETYLRFRSNDDFPPEEMLAIQQLSFGLPWDEVVEKYDRLPTQLNPSPLFDRYQEIETLSWAARVLADFAIVTANVPIVAWLMDPEATSPWSHNMARAEECIRQFAPVDNVVALQPSRSTQDDDLADYESLEYDRRRTRPHQPPKNPRITNESIKDGLFIFLSRRLYFHSLFSYMLATSSRYRRICLCDLPGRRGPSLWETALFQFNIDALYAIDQAWHLECGEAPPEYGGLGAPGPGPALSAAAPIPALPPSPSKKPLLPPHPHYHKSVRKVRHCLDITRLVKTTAIYDDVTALRFALPFYFCAENIPAMGEVSRVALMTALACLHAHHTIRFLITHTSLRIPPPPPIGIRGENIMVECIGSQSHCRSTRETLSFRAARTIELLLTVPGMAQLIAPLPANPAEALAKGIIDQEYFTAIEKMAKLDRDDHTGNAGESRFLSRGLTPFVFAMEACNPAIEYLHLSGASSVPRFGGIDLVTHFGRTRNQKHWRAVTQFFFTLDPRVTQIDLNECIPFSASPLSPIHDALFTVGWLAPQTKEFAQPGPSPYFKGCKLGPDLQLAPDHIGWKVFLPPLFMALAQRFAAPMMAKELLAADRVKYPINLAVRFFLIAKWPRQPDQAKTESPLDNLIHTSWAEYLNPIPGQPLNPPPVPVNQPARVADYHTISAIQGFSVLHFAVGVDKWSQKMVPDIIEYFIDSLLDGTADQIHQPAEFRVDCEPSCHCNRLDNLW